MPFSLWNICQLSTIEDTETQAIRSGAVMVEAQRHFNKIAKDNGQAAEKSGVDDKSFAFTYSWVP